MTNSETKMILTPRWYTVSQVAQLLNYGESKVRMLIITGRLRSIKDGRSRRILPEWVEAYVQDLASGRGHRMTGQTNGEVRSFRTAMDSQLTFGSRLRQGADSGSTSTVALARSSTPMGGAHRKAAPGRSSPRCRQLGSSSSMARRDGCSESRPAHIRDVREPREELHRARNRCPAA